MDLKLKPDLNMSYYLCPETFDDLIQQRKKEVNIFRNRFSSRSL